MFVCVCVCVCVILFALHAHTNTGLTFFSIFRWHPPPLPKVLEEIKTSCRGQEESGASCSVQTVVENIGSMYSEDDIRDTIAWLASEGHLYTTTDNDHFQAT